MDTWMWKDLESLLEHPNSPDGKWRNVKHQRENSAASIPKSPVHFQPMLLVGMHKRAVVWIANLRQYLLRQKERTTKSENRWQCGKWKNHTEEENFEDQNATAALSSATYCLQLAEPRESQTVSLTGPTRASPLVNACSYFYLVVDWTHRTFSQPSSAWEKCVKQCGRYVGMRKTCPNH